MVVVTRDSIEVEGVSVWRSTVSDKQRRNEMRCLDKSDSRRGVGRRWYRVLRLILATRCVRGFTLEAKATSKKKDE